MRILWQSNAPWVSSGYGVQSRHFLPRIKALGHDVAIMANFGLEGGMLTWDGMPVYPRRWDGYGQDIMCAHAQHFGADIILSLYDTWVYRPELYPAGIRWVPWLPIDHEPCPPPIAAKVSQAYDRIVYSLFAQDSLAERGIDSHYVPHGVDTAMFRPVDKRKARESLNWPTDPYIVGLVAANIGYPSRKAFSEHFRAFASFLKWHPGSLLYVHSHLAPNGEAQGMNLQEMVNELGIADSVLFADQYSYALGYDDATMSRVYNSLDVLMSATMGEGFGVPIIEAQACGVPVIVGDWTAMPELLFAGEKVSKVDSHALLTPLAAYQFLPDPSAIADALETLYKRRNDEALRMAARAGALAYDVDRVTAEYWAPVLATIEAKIKAEAGPRLEVA